MFRLNLDMELFENEEKSAELAVAILNKIREVGNSFANDEMARMRFRMSKDEDRRSKNYLNKDENGHASGKKSKLFGGDSEE